MYNHWMDSLNWFCSRGNLFPGPLGVMMNILFWGLVLYLIFTLGRTVFDVASGSRREKGVESPGAILKRRFARGEIDAGQYEEMRDMLMK